jgi:hypothetical protein
MMRPIASLLGVPRIFLGLWPQSSHPSLRNDDVVKVARHLEPALLAVGPVPYREALLHARLPGPVVDGVLAPHVAHAAPVRGGGGLALRVVGMGDVRDGFDIHAGTGVLHIRLLRVGRVVHVLLHGGVFGLGYGGRQAAVALDVVPVGIVGEDAGRILLAGNAGDVVAEVCDTVGGDGRARPSPLALLASNLRGKAGLDGSGQAPGGTVAVGVDVGEASGVDLRVNGWGGGSVHHVHLGILLGPRREGLVVDYRILRRQGRGEDLLGGTRRGPHG